MTTLKQRIADAIAEVRHELVAQARRRQLPEPVFQAGAPASDAAIARLEDHHQLRLPASYRAFLSLHDGYTGLAYGGDLLSIASMLPGSRRYDEICRWKRLCADYGSGEVVDGVVIASSTEPNNWLYIDPDRRSADDEYTLVQWLGDTSQDLDDLPDFFDYVVLCCRQAP